MYKNISDTTSKMQQIQSNINNMNGEQKSKLLKATFIPEELFFKIANFERF